MNSAGVGIVLNVVPTPAEEQRLVVPCCCLMPKVMRERRLGNALTLLCSHGRSMLNYTVGGKEGEIFCVETRPDDFNVLQPVNDTLVHANHFITERFKAGNSRSPGIIGSSYLRQQRLERLSAGGLLGAFLQRVSRLRLVGRGLWREGFHLSS